MRNRTWSDLIIVAMIAVAMPQVAYGKDLGSRSTTESGVGIGGAGGSLVASNSVTAAHSHSWRSPAGEWAIAPMAAVRRSL